MTRHFKSSEAALRALLDDDGKHLLTQLNNEQGQQCCFKTYAFFEAAFTVNRELNQILQ